ncbi:DUF2177 family protein [Candidatus Saccharibacteria bacterium]|nr:DUF2177 family protein [Candidatus Saccharibacteria bacterium]
MTITLVYFAMFAIVFGALDAVWLKSTNKLYKKYLGHLMREKPNFIAAIIFYGIYVLGVTALAFVPLIDGTSSAVQAIATAAFIAFLCYATYDLTNLATIKGWSIRIVVIDIIWGTVATALAAVIAIYTIAMFLGRS